MSSVERLFNSINDQYTNGSFIVRMVSTDFTNNELPRFYVFNAITRDCACAISELFPMHLTLVTFVSMA